VQANEVKPQLEIMSHNVLALQGELVLESSVWMQVSLRLGSEARTNGTQERTAYSKKIIVKSGGYHLFILLSFDVVIRKSILCKLRCKCKFR
jgi:hypothetical protein